MDGYTGLVLEGGGSVALYRRSMDYFMIRESISLILEFRQGLPPEFRMLRASVEGPDTATSI